MYAAPTPLLMHLYAIAPLAFLFFMLWLYKNKANQDKVKRVFDGICYVLIGILMLIWNAPGLIKSLFEYRVNKKKAEAGRAPEYGFYSDEFHRD